MDSEREVEDVSSGDATWRDSATVEKDATVVVEKDETAKDSFRNESKLGVRVYPVNALQADDGTLTKRRTNHDVAVVVFSAIGVVTLAGFRYRWRTRAELTPPSKSMV